MEKVKRSRVMVKEKKINNCVLSATLGGGGGKKGEGKVGGEGAERRKGGMKRAREVG